jgi:hypothetical protein
LPNPPIECSPRPQAIRRQSSTTEEILIARGFRRQSTTEEMIRCRNFRRQSSQSDDVCQRYTIDFLGVYHLKLSFYFFISITLLILFMVNEDECIFILSVILQCEIYKKKIKSNDDFSCGENNC